MQTFITGQKVVTTSGTPVRLGYRKLSNAAPLLIKAKAGNTGTITVGSSSAAALNTGDDFYSLSAGEGMTLLVDDLNDVWLDATVSGEGVEYATELQFA
jgi:hypothetical protein